MDQDNDSAGKLTRLPKSSSRRDPVADYEERRSQKRLRSNDEPEWLRRAEAGEGKLTRLPKSSSRKRPRSNNDEPEWLRRAEAGEGKLTRLPKSSSGSGHVKGYEERRSQKRPRSNNDEPEWLRRAEAGEGMKIPSLRNLPRSSSQKRQSPEISGNIDDQRGLRKVKRVKFNETHQKSKSLARDADDLLRSVDGILKTTKKPVVEKGDPSLGPEEEALKNMVNRHVAALKAARTRCVFFDLDDTLIHHSITNNDVRDYIFGAGSNMGMDANNSTSFLHSDRQKGLVGGAGEVDPVKSKYIKSLVPDPDLVNAFMKACVNAGIKVHISTLNSAEFALTLVEGHGWPISSISAGNGQILDYDKGNREVDRSTVTAPLGGVRKLDATRKVLENDGVNWPESAFYDDEFSKESPTKKKLESLDVTCGMKDPRKGPRFSRYNPGFEVEMANVEVRLASKAVQKGFQRSGDNVSMDEISRTSEEKSPIKKKVSFATDLIKGPASSSSASNLIMGPTPSSSPRPNNNEANRLMTDSQFNKLRAGFGRGGSNEVEVF